MKQILKNILTIKHLWGGIIPLNILGVYAIYSLIDAPSWWWMTFIAGYILMKVLGIGAGFHRLLAHRAFEVSRPMKIFILWCGTISGQGSPILWAGAHRVGHHKHSDTDKDVHSPKHGFFHSYILWMFKLKDGDVYLRPIIDLLRDKDVMFFHKNYSNILWITHLLFAVISINLWLYFLILPAFITLHVFCLQTSVVHYKWAGYQNFNTQDNSRNVPWLFPVSQGECWHNNHHGEPWNANFGKRWWEIDPTYWVIKLISRRLKTL